MPAFDHLIFMVKLDLNTTGKQTNK